MYLSAKRVRDLFHYRHAETGSEDALHRRFFSSDKRFENMLQQFRRHPYTVVSAQKLVRYRIRVRIFLFAHSDLDKTAVRSILYRIGTQIYHDLYHTAVISDYTAVHHLLVRYPENYALFNSHRFQHIVQFGHEVSYIELLLVKCQLSLLYPVYVQDLIDHFGDKIPGHTYFVKALRDFLPVVYMMSCDVAHAYYHIQRRPYFMRHV